MACNKSYLVTDEIGTLNTFDSVAFVLVLLMPCCDCEYDIVKVTAPCLSKTTVKVWHRLSAMFSLANYQKTMQLSVKSCKRETKSFLSAKKGNKRFGS